MTASAWTDDRVGRLKTLWLEGRSAAEIARDLDHGLTRSAVLGKVYRLGLSAGRTPASRFAHAVKRPVARPLRPAAGAPPAPDAHPAPAALEGTATILTVRRFECRWPYGDPRHRGFALCGRRVARGAFCAAHAAIAYRPVRQEAEDLARLAGLV